MTCETIYRFFGWWIINIDMFLLCYFLGGSALLAFKKKRVGRRLLTLSCCGFAFLGIVPVGIWSVEQLENRFPYVDTIPADVKGVIFLGGTFDLWTTPARPEPSYNLAAGRFIRLMELLKKYPHLQFVFTGTKLEADTTRKELLAVGINPDQIIFEENALNTSTNAANAAQIIQPHTEDKWLLLTSAYHMPRSVGLFRKAGFTIIPYPVDYHTPGNYEPLFFVGLKRNLDGWHASSREWLGMVANYIFGRSNELFPRP